jgi:exodeoxyribonuclease V alpha subunit
LINFICRVDRLIYKKDNFTIFSANINNSAKELIQREANGLIENTITILGNFFKISPDDELEIFGTIERSKMGQYQISAKEYKRIKPASQKTLIKFFMKFQGIGKATATELVKRLGCDAINKILEDKTILLGIKGIKESRMNRISEALKSKFCYEELLVFLLASKIPSNKCLEIIEYVNGDLKLLRLNPYIISSISSLSIMDKIAKKNCFKFDDPLRIRAIITEYLKWQQKMKGHLYANHGDILNEINGYIKNTMESVYSENYLRPELLTKEIQELIAEGTIINDKNCIYLTYNYNVERKIAKEIERHLVADKVRISFRENLMDDGMADEQKEAVRMALSSNISILGGGPGTGKTFTLAQIIKNIQTTAPNAMIQLGAPTGKAAKRITESTGMPAKTLHRMMGLQADYLKQDLENLIVADFLIIDESSMIDAYLFLKLLEATPEECKILLVGDFQQLPSVGAGNVLEDLIESGVVPVVELKKIFRQGESSDIIVNSHAMINNSEIRIERRKDFYFCQEESVEKINERIMKAIDTLISDRGYRLDDIQVLSPMKRNLIGVSHLNNQIQSRFNNNNSGVEINEFSLRRNDRVIQTENNYDLGVFNGEVGKITKIESYSDIEYEITVDFGDGKEIVFNEKNCRKLELAYAMTIHKSQGSEFPVVIMPVHSSHKIMLNKNLVYTGWTRAKELLITYGEIESIKYAQSREDGIVRNSKIRERIIERIKEKTPRKEAI